MFADVPSLIWRLLNLIAQIKGSLLYLENIGETGSALGKLSLLTHVNLILGGAHITIA